MDCRGKTHYFVSIAYSKVMVTTGLPGSAATRKTEILDLENGITCSELADFPVELSSAVGANLHGTPVVCGGFSSGLSEKCYRFNSASGVWEDFTSMKEKRSWAAGVMYNENLHVFGGYYHWLYTSETINVDGGVSDGPDLLTGVYFHAMTAINDTVSLLSGGCIPQFCSSMLTWYYNHETESFTSGPDLLEGRRGHGSATIVDKVTKAKIAIITGGVNYNFGYLDSTEMLINGQWQTGTILGRKQTVLICSCAICLPWRH